MSRKQGGFSLVESIIIIALAVVVVFLIYNFGWASREPAGETALQTHTDTLQKAVDLFFYDSNGRYPTVDGKLPKPGESKLIIWDASLVTGGKELLFFPNYVKRKPGHWDEGIWRIDSVGKVYADIDPKEY